MTLSHPFVRIAASRLTRLGGNYAEWVRRQEARGGFQQIPIPTDFASTVTATLPVPESLAATSQADPAIVRAQAAPRVFIVHSYDANAFVVRLEEDLEASGYEVLAFDPPEKEANRLVVEADIVVVCMSPYAELVDRFWYGDLAWALNQKPPKIVVPILVSDCEAPKFLAHLEQIDMRGWDQSTGKYAEGLTRVLSSANQSLSELFGNKPDQESDFPGNSAIASLPSLARLALVARSLRRAQRIIDVTGLEVAWRSASINAQALDFARRESFAKTVASAIEAVESISAGTLRRLEPGFQGLVREAAMWAKEAASELHKHNRAENELAAQASHFAHRAAAFFAEAAGDAIARQVFAAMASLRRAVFLCGASAELDPHSPVVVAGDAAVSAFSPAVWGDLCLLGEAARNGGWTNDTPVPVEFITLDGIPDGRTDEPMSEPRPSVFIAHAIRNREFVQKHLGAFLLSSNVSVDFWVSDLAEEGQDDVWIEHEPRASCEWFVVVLSRLSMGSRLIKKEIEWALEHRRGRLITIQTDDVGPEGIHSGLLSELCLDFRGNINDGCRRLLAALRQVPLPASTSTLDDPVVVSLEISPDLKTIAVGYSTGRVVLRNAKDGRECGSFLTSAAEVKCITWSRDGRNLACGCEDGLIHIVNVNPGMTIGRLTYRSGAPVSDVGFSSDDKMLAASIGDTIVIWDWRVSRIQTELCAGGDAGAITFAPHGQKLFSLSGLRLVSWDLETAREAWVWPIFERNWVTLAMASRGNQMALVGMRSFSHGHWLAIFVHPEYAREPLVRIHSTATGQEAHIIHGNKSAVTDLVVSPDGASVATSCLDGTVRVWDAATGQEKRIVADVSDRVERALLLCRALSNVDLTRYSSERERSAPRTSSEPRPADWAPPSQRSNQAMGMLAKKSRRPWWKFWRL